MKKKNFSTEIVRLENMISSDRLNVNSNFVELLQKDSQSILKDYFDLKTEPIINIVKQDGLFYVNIECHAVRIKPFGNIPK